MSGDEFVIIYYYHTMRDSVGHIPAWLKQSLEESSLCKSVWQDKPKLNDADQHVTTYIHYGLCMILHS